MDTSLLLARVFGVVMAIVYLSVLFNRKYYRHVWREISSNKLLLMLSGFIALVLGVLTLQFHPEWTADWRSIITLLGWLMVLQGVVRLAVPDKVIGFSSRLLEANYNALLGVIVIFLIIALFLIYKGFGY